MSTTVHLQVYLFGEFRLLRNGVLVPSKDWHTRQARQLFKLLLTEHGHSVSTRKLTDLLWSEYVESPHKALRSAISALRDVLEPGRDPWLPSRFVPRGRGGYTLAFPPDCVVWVDVYEFERLLDAALVAANSAEAQTTLETALQLYTGDYLAEDEAANWAMSRRSRLRERYFSGVARLMEWWGKAERYDEAIALGRRALVFDACREPLYRLIMEYQALNGDNAAALQAFEDCRQALDAYLGADPSPQTLALHTAILMGKFPELTSISPVRVSSREGAPVAAERPPLRHDPPFIGRQSELSWLTQQLDDRQADGRSGHDGVVALVGEAGIGKTSLLRLFLRRAHARNIPTLSATCQALEQDIAFAPVISMLKTWLAHTCGDQLAALPRITLARVAALLPEIAMQFPDLEAPPTINSEHAYSMFVIGLTDLFIAIGVQGPFVLAFDDLQWADESTLLVLNRLAYLEQGQQKMGHPFLLLVSYRPEDVSENGSLSEMLHHLSRNRRLYTLPLGAFTLAEVAEYLQAYHATIPVSSDKLHQVTQGNALFLAEAVRTLLEQQECQQEHAGSGGYAVVDSLLYSQQIRDIVLERVERLPQHALELLEIASVIGHPFEPALLQTTMASEDYAALDLLLKRRFLVEAHTGAEHDVQLSLSHEIVGQIIYMNCTAVRAARLHLQVAQSLERRYAGRVDTCAAEIARHYSKTGSNSDLQCLHYTLLAADYARRTFSYRQALAHYDAALHLLERQALGSNGDDMQYEEWLGKIYHGRGLVYEALLDWKGIQESHRSLSTWAAIRKDMVLANGSAHRVVLTRSLMGHLSEAVDMGRALMHRLQAETEALQTLPQDSREGLRILTDMTNRWTHILTLDDAQDHMQVDSTPSSWHFPPFCAASPVGVQDWDLAIERLGPSQSAFTLTSYGWALLLQGLSADAEHCLQAALKTAEATDQITWGILASMHLSRIYSFSGRHEQGALEMKRCLERCQQVPEATWITVWPLLNQAYYLMGAGQLDMAEHILLLLQKQLTAQDLPAYRFSTQIGLGLLALAREQFERADSLLREALSQKQNIYIEVYVLAEIGLARIAQCQGHYAEAYTRLQNMLAFSGERSLLELYVNCALSLGRLSLCMQQAQGVAGLLEDAHRLIAAAGSPWLARECSELLAQIS